MSTLAILRSSAEQVALSWGKPKPSACRGLAMTDMLRSSLQTLKNVAIALKNPHGDGMPRALRDGVVRCSGRGKMNRAVEYLPESINIQQTYQLPTKKKETKKEKETDPAAQTGWQKEQAGTWVGRASVCCCLGSLPIFVVGFPRETSQASGCRVTTRDRFPGFSSSPKVGTFNPTLSRAHPPPLR